MDDIKISQVLKKANSTNKEDKMNVYISGPITGVDNLNIEAFANAEKLIIEAGHTPINPHKICEHLPPNSPWVEYMKVCIPKLIHDAHAVFLLPNWDKSNGAQGEVYNAALFSIPCFESFTDLIDLLS